MTGRVVGVHGIGNTQRGTTPAEAAAVLGDRWTAALRRGLGQEHGVQTVIAYYAHHLDTDTPQGAGDPEHLSEPEQQMLLRWAQQLGAPPEVAQGRLATPARAAADWIARRFGLDHTVVRLLVTTFCREVHLYLNDPTRRDAVRTTVADTIVTHQPAVVIAHSLGSALALPDIVFPHLHPAPDHGKGHRPPGVRRWINIADPGDFIAIPTGLARYFQGIDTDLTTPIGVFNTHKVTGYLACPTTAAALATLLGR
jgi:hypothetical protein